MADVWAPRSRSDRDRRGTPEFTSAFLRNPGISSTPLCSVNGACRALNPRGGGSSPPRGTKWPCSPIRQRQQVESLSSGGSNPPVVTVAARGAIGRRGTFRPCRSGFESPRGGHPSTGFESHRGDHSEGDIVEGKDAALSAREYGFESRCPRQNGLVAQREDPWFAPRR